jgi:hypothetical protein
MVPLYPYFKGPSAATDYETWAATWEAFLVSVVDEAVSLNQNWQWDIWNEPNWPTFWIGTKSQYFETWKRAHRIIRSRIPNAVIVGPSIAYYDESYLTEFLLYAQSNNVLPDALSWHELIADSPGAIESRVAAMRRFMTENAIPVSRIQLNEITAQSHQFRPGSSVWFFAAIERAGVEAACKSCWLDGFEHNCINDSLNGLLNSPALEPRSSYWAYKVYADITGRVVELAPSESFDGVVGVDPSSPAVRGIIGNHATERRSMNVRLDGFSEAFGTGPTAVTVRAYLIPNSEREPLAALTPLMNEVRP